MEMNANSAAETVFFDLETTVPNQTGRRFWVLEFGAIIVRPQKLVELKSYCTLIRPGDLSMVSLKSGRSDGITRETVADAPMFEDVADCIFDILDGKVWPGHNIQRFVCVRIKEAFADISRPPPVPVGIIDSLGVLSQKFGRRAGNMKMASLANNFGLGQQKHRSLADVRMNLEVLKHCATVLFLVYELSFPTVTTRSRSNSFNLSNKNEGETSSRKSPPTCLGIQKTVPCAKGRLRKVTERMTDVLCKIQGKQHIISNILRYSHLALK
ncbi:hypothetical protein MKX01_037094 [Papaver californicum]|nr:hypothetical protein MKX01_037094 [Papaver californicum]